MIHINDYNNKMKILKYELIHSIKIAKLSYRTLLRRIILILHIKTIDPHRTNGSLMKPDHCIPPHPAFYMSNLHISEISSRPKPHGRLQGILPIHADFKGINLQQVSAIQIH